MKPEGRDRFLELTAEEERAAEEAQREEEERLHQEHLDEMWGTWNE